MNRAYAYKPEQFLAKGVRVSHQFLKDEYADILFAYTSLVLLHNRCIVGREKRTSSMFRLLSPQG